MIPLKRLTAALSCRPCRTRYAALGGHAAGGSYHVGGRVRAEAGHFLYRPPLVHEELDGYAIPLCQAARRPATPDLEETMSAGPVDVRYTYEIILGEDGAEVMSDANPAGSWLIHADGGTWVVQPSGPDPDDARAAIFNSVGEALGYTLRQMVVSALAGDEVDDGS